MSRNTSELISMIRIGFQYKVIIKIPGRSEIKIIYSNFSAPHP